ncbi:MAG: tetraacyldisaccharide 4'-kinase [Hyphomicrobiaceae bacterium]
MPIDPPRWWYPGTARPGPWSRIAPWLLSPASGLIAIGSRLRTWRATPYEAGLPVICIGNFTAGGTGKTPLAIEIAKRLKAKGFRPFILTRGYGGTITGPYDVNPDRDVAARVGDEPLLLARVAPVVVARDRAMGARHIERMGADVIIMDDGMQNPSLAKTLTIAVVDGTRGLGNGWTMPSGPARAPLADQVPLADAVVVNGNGSCTQDSIPNGFAGAVLYGKLSPAPAAASLADKNVVAFSGIGNPSRFHETLAGCGATLVAQHSFADHHTFTDIDARKIIASAATGDTTIVTTEKDLVRLPHTPEANPRTELRKRSYALPVEFRFQDSDSGRLDALLEMALGQRKVQAGQPGPSP